MKGNEMTVDIQSFSKRRRSRNFLWTFVKGFVGRLISGLRFILQRAFLFPYLGCFLEDFELIGLENLDLLEGSACVFAANHASHADTAVILYALPQQIRSKLAIAAAADYFYKSKLRGAFFTLLLNTFAFDREKPKHGLLQGREVLNKGFSLLIYPEGSRRAPSEQKGFKRGFAALACRMSLPVVPVHLEGTYEMLPKGACWPRAARVKVVFGKPVYSQGINSHELALKVERNLRALVPAA
ncbi:MAG: 1-acyl-sn-glycerol-3-phosphate acyltransferase [Candidatus Obscuribacterales bacterium]|nr:1-acyl-sn-glycerol-3-phosphate acyltransferase [Candidatus Obscuribacterales bacterium]